MGMFLFEQLPLGLGEAKVMVCVMFCNAAASNGLQFVVLRRGLPDERGIELTANLNRHPRSAMLYSARVGWRQSFRAIADQRTKVSAVYWNTQRTKIYDWMVANGQESFAELYKGAVINLYEKNPGHVRFVSHAVRDIMNGMAACVLGQKRYQVEYVALVGKLHRLWDGNGLPKGPETLNLENVEAASTGTLALSSKVTLQIQLLLREHQNGRRRSEDSPNLFFHAFLPDQEAFK